MSQVTIYLDDDAIILAKSAATVAKLSLSAWISKLVKEQAPQVDANGYPVGFFNDMAANAQHWQDFPQAEALSNNGTPDLQREVW